MFKPGEHCPGEKGRGTLRKLHKLGLLVSTVSIFRRVPVTRHLYSDHRGTAIAATYIIAKTRLCLSEAVMIRDKWTCERTNEKTATVA
jgi:hypothetical protein